MSSSPEQYTRKKAGSDESRFVLEGRFGRQCESLEMVGSEVAARPFVCSKRHDRRETSWRGLTSVCCLGGGYEMMMMMRMEMMGSYVGGSTPSSSPHHIHAGLCSNSLPAERQSLANHVPGHQSHPASLRYAPSDEVRLCHPPVQSVQQR